VKRVRIGRQFETEIMFWSDELMMLWDLLTLEGSIDVDTSSPS
jgi:hypothetical protein